jgi:hypothetical protein
MLNNVNEGGWRTNKHAKLWGNNAFDKWRKFSSYNNKKFITNLFYNEDIIMGLVDML